MHKLLLLALVLLCCGCARERAQHASDVRAGLHAAAVAIKVGESDKAVSILAGADARLPAVADVPSVDFPAPSMTAEQINADPQRYITTAPPEPKGMGWKTLAILGTVGSIGLYGLKILAPMIPGGGPIVGKVADLAWGVLAHKDQRKADDARQVVHDNAPLLLSLLSEAKGIPGIGAKISPELESAVAMLVQKS